MPVIEGTRNLKTWQGSYDFAVDGGAVSSITIRSDDGVIPSGSVILAGYAEVTTAVTGGASATLAVQVEGAGDTIAAAAVSGAPWSTTGRKSVIPVFTGATALKTTADRSPKAVIAVAALTAGVVTITLVYR